ncbi:MAG TPA: protein kinase, partial [Polyangiales bacterium]|nr:protein kinase [Polyangiales bacterium]
MSLDSAATAGSSLIGQSIDGRYRLEAQIGVGGLGTVYRATHTKLDRAVAVKVLHESYGASAVQRARFEREAKALATVEHTNIVSVMDYGVAEDRPYLVMELLEGETLSQRLKRGPMPVEGAVSIAQQMLGALAFMHSGGLLHRDIKPSNVFIQRMHDGKERVKVLDFGLAKFTAPVAPGSDADPTLTRDGSIVGTPAYMSPEQATGESVDPRSDVYAMGVILFQMLTGRLPFEGDAIEQVRGHLVSPVPALGRIGADRRIDAALDQAVQRAMAKRREDRFGNGAEMLSALVEIYPDLLSPYRSTFEISTVRPATKLDDDGFENPSSEPSIALSSRDLETASSLLEITPPPSAAGRLRVFVRTLFVTSVRLVATASVLLVLVTVIALALLMRSEPDRADLLALRQRMSERWIARAAHPGLPAKEPIAAAKPPPLMAAGASASTQEVAIAAPEPPPSLAAGSLAPPEALPPSAATVEATTNDAPPVAEQTAPEPAETIPGPPAAR